jgi:hypothetical protein
MPTSGRTLLLLFQRAGQDCRRFDSRTLQLVTQIKLSERPNKIVVNKKHRKIYAGIRNRSGTVAGPGFKASVGGALPAVVDVIDIATHKVIRSIPVHHPVHNTYVRG